MAFFESKGIIGVDIGTSSVKILEIQDTKKLYRLKNFGIAAIPRDTIINGVIMNAEPVVDAIREIITRHHIKTKNTSLSVSGHPVIVKKLTLPIMDEKKLEESIPFEAQQYIPFALEEVNIDFQVLGPSEEKKDYMNIILVAAKKAMVNDYVNLITSAGLNPMIIDIDVFALENMFEFNYPEELSKNIALIDIGASVININILQKGISTFTRDIFLGGHQITEEIQKQIGVSYEKAENLKLGKELQNDNKEIVENIIQKSLSSIVSEIQRSLDFFTAQTSNEIHKIYLSGGVVKTPGIIDLIYERTGIQTEVVDCLKSVQYDHSRFDLEYLKEMSPLMAVGVGLAIRRVNDK